MLSPQYDDLQVVPATPSIRNEKKSCAIVPSSPNAMELEEPVNSTSRFITHSTAVDAVHLSSNRSNRFSLQPSRLNLPKTHEESLTSSKNKEDQMVPQCDSIHRSENQTHTISPVEQTIKHPIKSVLHPNILNMCKKEQKALAMTSSVIQKDECFSSADYFYTKEGSTSSLGSANVSGLFSNVHVGSVVQYPQNNLKPPDPQHLNCTSLDSMTSRKQTDRNKTRIKNNLQSTSDICSKVVRRAIPKMKDIKETDRNKIGYGKDNLQSTSDIIICSKRGVQQAIPKMKTKDNISCCKEGRATVQLERKITVSKPVSEDVPPVDFFDGLFFL